MNPSPRPSRLVPAFAVVTVSVVALCAAWTGAAGDAPSTLPVQAQRPAADAPVQVVRSPAAAGAVRQPVDCRACAVPALQGARL